MTDAQRLDFLEEFINKEGGILLHDGTAKNFGFAGLGLRPGTLNRTLRQAIDDCAGVETSREAIYALRRKR
jgi:hypothetical protein